MAPDKPIGQMTGTIVSLSHLCFQVWDTLLWMVWFAFDFRFYILSPRLHVWAPYRMKLYGRSNGSCGQFMPGVFSVGQIQNYKNKRQSHDWQKASDSKSVFVRHFGVFSPGPSYGDNSNSAAKQIGSDDVAVRTA